MTLLVPQIDSEQIRYAPKSFKGMVVRPQANRSLGPCHEGVPGFDSPLPH